MGTEYHPELDQSEELNEDLASPYQLLIGILRWIVELGRIDIITELSMLSSHLALPRQGHLEAAIRIFSYLDKHNARTTFYPKGFTKPSSTCTVRMLRKNNRNSSNSSNESNRDTNTKNSAPPLPITPFCVVACMEEYLQKSKRRLQQQQSPI